MKTLVEESSTSFEERPGFFARQFAPKATQAQNIFDLIFGVVGPVCCYYFDPAIFRGGGIGVGAPMLSRYQLFAYALSLIQIPLLLVWLVLRRQLHSLSAPIGGALLAGSVFSFLVGVFILPYTVLGLIILVGILGFTPFFTAFVYLRNAWRALSAQERNFAYSSRYLTAVLAGIISIGLPILVGRVTSETVRRSTYSIISGDAKQAELAVNQISWLPFIPQESLDIIIAAYQSSTDPVRKELLRKSYRQLTGEDIDTRIMIFND